jgi:hypothetical protein
MSISKSQAQLSDEKAIQNEPEPPVPEEEEPIVEDQAQILQEPPQNEESGEDEQDEEPADQIETRSRTSSR